MPLRLLLRSTLGAVLAAALLILPVSAQAGSDDLEPAAAEDCRLSLRAPPEVLWRGPFSRGYVSDHSDIHLEPVSIDIHHDGAACSYRIDIAPADGVFELKHGGGALAFGLRSGDGGRASGLSSPLTLASAYPMSGGSRSVDILVDVEPGQRVRAGRYSHDLEIRLFRITSTQAVLEDTARLTVYAEVWPQVSASIGTNASAGRATAEINLGVIAAGTEAVLDFAVHANTPYEIQIASENKGNLRHHLSDALLPYELSLDGRLIKASDVSTGTVVSSGNTSRSHDLDLLIRDVSGLPAGYYTDRLTVTITGQ